VRSQGKTSMGSVFSEVSSGTSVRGGKTGSGRMKDGKSVSGEKKIALNNALSLTLTLNIERERGR